MLFFVLMAPSFFPNLSAVNIHSSGSAGILQYELVYYHHIPSRLDVRVSMRPYGVIFSFLFFLLSKRDSYTLFNKNPSPAELHAG